MMQGLITLIIVILSTFLFGVLPYRLGRKCAGEKEFMDVRENFGLVMEKIFGWMVGATMIIFALAAIGVGVAMIFLSWILSKHIMEWI